MISVIFGRLDAWNGLIKMLTNPINHETGQDGKFPSTPVLGVVESRMNLYLRNNEPKKDLRMFPNVLLWKEGPGTEQDGEKMLRIQF